MAFVTLHPSWYENTTYVETLFENSPSIRLARLPWQFFSIVVYCTIYVYLSYGFLGEAFAIAKPAGNFLSFPHTPRLLFQGNLDHSKHAITPQAEALAET